MKFNNLITTNTEIPNSRSVVFINGSANGAGSSNSPEISKMRKRQIKRIVKEFRRETNGYYKETSTSGRIKKMFPNRLKSLAVDAITLGSYIATPFNPEYFSTSLVTTASSLLTEGFSNELGKAKGKVFLSKYKGALKGQHEQYEALRQLLNKESGFISGFFKKARIAKVLKSIH